MVAELPYLNFLSSTFCDGFSRNAQRASPADGPTDGGDAGAAKPTSHPCSRRLRSGGNHLDLVAAAKEEDRARRELRLAT